MKPTVLIVDDEAAGRKVIESVLLNQGYHLEFANNGKEALQMASTLKPDLLLLDLMLPEMDGIEVCQALRKDKELAEMPVVMVTALDDRNTRIACLDAGADDFISKPFDRAELRARVRSITRLNRYRLLHERDLITSWIADNASDGYLQVQTDDRILFANPRARFYLGLDLDSSKPITETFMEIVSRQYLPHPQPAWEGWPASAISTGQNRYLVRPESNTAHEFWLETMIFELHGSENRTRTRLIRLCDVTADILNRRNTRSFGEAITHKIRTPVTHIISSLELLARMAPQLKQEEIIKFSSTALYGARRLQETLDRILKYSNLHANLNSPEGFELSGLSRLAEKIGFEMGILQITTVIPEEMNKVQVTLSVQSVEVLLWEVLGNSKKFHPNRTPAISIDVVRAGPQQIVIRITDDGVTLSPKQLATAWMPYYQGEKDFTGEAPGMGLGLPTVSAIVWGAGGACQIMNRDGRPGVTVELAIPEVNVQEVMLTGGLHGRI